MKTTTSTAIPTTSIHLFSIHLFMRVLVVGLLLVSTSVKAQRSNTRITSVHVEDTNVVVTARIPAGPHEAILESRAGFGTGLWETRASVPLDGTGSNVTFRLSRSLQTEFLRVRLDGVTNPPLRMVVFGDSLTDTGNHFERYGSPFTPPSYLGRYSDGPVWIEYLTTRLGIAPDEWVNYAVGGAASGRDNSGDHPDAPGMLNELDDYFSEAAGPGQVDPDALYVLWIGANDFAIWQKTKAFTDTSPEVLVGGLLGNIRTAIERLADRGAKRFLVLNLPDLGQIPLTQNSPEAFAAPAASLGTLGFNLNLAWMLGELESGRSNSIDIVHFDIYSLFNWVLAKPADFGLSDVHTACWPGGTNTPCDSPSTHLFWDDRHPTTKIHSNIAHFAMLALQKGGTHLPVGCPVPAADNPSVTIATRNGIFTTASQVEISGTVSGAMPAGAELKINGVRATPGGDGGFAMMVPLGSNAVSNPILAEIRTGDTVLSRDRIVIYRGPAVQVGQTVSDAVVATMNSSGLDALSEYILQKLSAADELNLFNRLPDPPPMFFSFPGCDGAGVDLWFTGAGYSCVTVTIEPRSDKVRVYFGLNDVFVNYGAHGWLIGCPDPGPNCFGGVTSPGIQVHVDFRVTPKIGGNPGEVEVTPLSEIEPEPFSVYHHVFDCNHDFNIGDDILRAISPNIENALHDEIYQQLTQQGGGRFLADGLAEGIAKLSVSGQLGGILGATVNGDIQDVRYRSGQLEVRFETEMNGSNVRAQESYAVPMGALRHPSVDPVGGAPYDFAASVSLASLNQLILAESGRIPEQWEVAQLDLGTGPLPVTAGMLSLFFPALRAESPQTPYKLVLRPRLLPMLLGESSNRCTGVEAAIDDLRIDIVRTGGGRDERVLGAALDLRACVNFKYDRTKSALIFGLEFSPETLRNVVITDNRICADDLVLEQILRMGLKTLVEKIGGLTFPFQLPQPDDLSITPVQIVPEHGYVSAYVSLKPAHGRPDVVIAEVDAPEAIDVNFSFPIRVRVKNVGFEPAYGSIGLGASLSTDLQVWNGNDLGIGIRNFNFGGGQLRPGESEWFTFIADPAPSAIEGNQWLFVAVDVPLFVGGVGAFCEVNEVNNLYHQPITTTRADAYVESVVAPDGLVGGGLPGAYLVRVGRSDIGIDLMDVPVRVTVGDPVVFWGDAVVRVPRGGQETATVYVNTPFAIGPICDGAVNQFPILACTHLAFDPNPDNDCRSNSVRVAVPYYDLRYEVNGPTNAHVNDTVNWTVTIHNAGNMWSPTISSRTAIGLARGEDYTPPSIVNGSLRSFTVSPLAPNGSVTLPFSAVITAGAVNNQFIKAGIDPLSGGSDACTVGNYDDEPITICGADLNIIDIELPPSLVGSVGPRTYYVTVRNDGCDPARNVWVRTCVVGACQDVGPLDVGVGATHRIAISLPTPASSGAPGQTNYLPVTACLLNWFDATPLNNCRTEQAGVAVPYWDLRFSIIGSPVSARLGQTIGWTVRVTNVGNVSSDDVCFRNGIGRYSAPKSWLQSFPVPPIQKSSGNIPPGVTRNIPVSLTIRLDAFTTSQFVKAEVDYDGGCFDHANNEAGNNAYRAIQINP